MAEVVRRGRQIRSGAAQPGEWTCDRGTPPFGHPTPVRTFVDRDLLAHEVVWAGQVGFRPRRG